MTLIKIKKTFNSQLRNQHLLFLQKWKTNNVHTSNFLNEN